MEKIVLEGATLTWNPIANPRGLVLICPGGGYEHLSPRESEPVERAFEEHGLQGIIVYYSCYEGTRLGWRPLHELGAALLFARDKFPGIPVFVCGFSAGGHLAASLGVFWEREGYPRPDGLLLCYPVITAGEYAHAGSIANLAEPGTEGEYSLERYAGPQVPPTFLWHTSTDADVPVENSLLFAHALARAHVPVELHVYPRGVHGLSLVTKEVDQPEKGRTADPYVAGWFDRCIAFVNDRISRKS